MQLNAKNNSLTKKVLFSILAAGLLSGFALSAEADEQYITIFNGEDSQENRDFTWVWVERAQENNSAKLTLNGGKVTGSKFEKTEFGNENHLSWYLIGTSYPKKTNYPNNMDLEGIEQAEVAVFVNKSCTELIATNVHFTGEVAVDGYKGDPKQDDEREGEAKITINGGSITAGKYYYHDPNSSQPISEDHATNILAYYNGKIELNNVVINSNISAYSGGVINVNNSSVDTTKDINVAKKIYAADEGSVINISFNANDDATVKTADANTRGILNVGKQIFADKGAKISIDNANINVTNTDGSIESTGAGSLVELKNSTITADSLVASASGKLTLDNNSSATVKAITVAHRFSDDSGGGTIEIYGNVKTNDLKANDNGTIKLDGGADAVYEVARYVSVDDGGKLFIKSGTLKGIEPNGSFTISGGENESSIVLEGTGVLSTISKNIYTNEASAIQNNPGNFKNNGIVFTGGSLILNDAQYTLSYAQAAQAMLNEKGSTKLTMAGNRVDENGNVKNTMSTHDIYVGANENIDFDQLKVIGKGNLLVGSYNSNVGSVIDGIKVQDAVPKGFGAGFLDLGSEGANSLFISQKKEVTLGGSLGGNLITVNDKDAGNIKVVVGLTEAAATAANLSNINAYNGYNGTLNIGNSLATADTKYTLNGDVIVNPDSNLNIKGQTEITKSLTLNEGKVDVIMGSLKTKDLKISGDSKLLGKVNAEALDIDAGKKLLIGSDDKAGKLTVETAKLNDTGMVFLDPAWKDGTTISDASGLAVKNITTADGAYVAGRDSVLALGADLTAAEDKFAKSGYAWGDGEEEISAAAYIAKSVDLGTGSITVDGSLTAAPTLASGGTLVLADNSLLIVDAAQTKTDAAIKGVTTATIDGGSALFIDGAKKGETYHILAGTASDINNAWVKDAIESNNSLLKFTNANVAGEYTVTAAVKSMNEAFGAGQVIASNTYDAALKKQNDGDAAYDFIMSVADSRTNAGEAAQVSALNSAAALGELAGVEHSTYAASNLFADAVAEHLSLSSEKEHDSDIWAKYIHSKDKVEGLAVAGFGANYDAKYNGIVVGADLYKSGKAAVGAALTYVDGSINGSTLAARTRNEAAYYGASIYGSLQNDDSAVIGDISYLHGKHDITQYNSGYSLTADAKADAFSVGVRAEKSLKAGVGKFVPYAGLRYLHLDTGNYTSSIGMSYDGDDMNLWLLPVGVKYSADVKAGGWTIRPIAEVGYVWNMGDCDATQTVSLNGASDGFGYDVADSGSYIARLGVEAEKANITYGLGYEYQKGDSVKSNRWTARLNWSF